MSALFALSAFFRRLSAAAARALCLALLSAAAPLAVAADKADGRVLLELFTSQGCYSCPPAEALLRDKYANDPRVVALEFHVDYWDDLVYGAAGVWADPFSSREYTERQTAYNQNIRKTRGVFTPQIIAHGQKQSAGAQEARIDSFVAEFLRAPQTHSLSFLGSAKTGWEARLQGPLQGDERLYYAVFWREKTTAIPSGENKGKTLTSRNVVKTMQSVAANSRVLRAPPIDEKTEGCAVWTQKPHGAVLVAALCPPANAAKFAKIAAVVAKKQQATKTPQKAQ